MVVGGLSVGLLRGQRSFLADFRSSQELIALLLMMLAAAGALVSLWRTILLAREWVFVQPRHRRTVVVALMAGLAAVAYWFFSFRVASLDAKMRKALIESILLLLPASILALRYLCVLLLPSRNSHESSSA